MSEEKEVVEQRLCKGQMPAPLVWYIRFHEDTEEQSMLGIAKKYFTTGGKITDIVKANNQKYIQEDMVWSDEELDNAKEQIEANFVRGQDDENATKRKLATTTAEDAEYSLEVIEEIRGMELSGVSLAEARAEYNEANPRKKREKVEDVTAPETDSMDEELDELIA